MSSEYSQRLNDIFVYKVMFKHSDAEHHLKQSDIQRLLESEYGQKVDRKRIPEYLEDLVEIGVDLERDLKTRTLPDGSTQEVADGWWLNHAFEISELRFLMDGVFNSHYLPTKQAEQLLKKLEDQQSKYFHAHVRHIINLEADVRKDKPNQEVFYTIDELDEAITHRQRVQFYYGSYDTDGQLKERRAQDAKHGESGQPRLYRADPYQMVNANGRYYLICRLYDFDSVSYLRIDRIMDVHALEDQPRTEYAELPCAHGRRNIDLPKHLAEHVYMFSGEPELVRFRIKLDANRSMLNNVFDWFGFDVTLENITDQSVDCVVRAQLQAMEYWCMQFSQQVEVLSPPELRTALLADAHHMLEMYQE